MTYATQDDMIDRFGMPEILQRTDRNRTGAIDAAVLNRALADADARIDGYLSGRYQVPLTVVPHLIVGIACDLARYALYDDIVTDGVKKRNDDAIKLLESISKGIVGLGVDSLGNKATVSDGAQIESSGKVFGRTGNDFL